MKAACARWRQTAFFFVDWADLKNVVSAIAEWLVVGGFAAAKIERSRPIRDEAHRFERRALM